MEAHSLQTPGKGGGTQRRDEQDDVRTVMMKDVKEEKKEGIGGPCKDELKTSSSPSIKLGLGICSESSENHDCKTAMISNKKKHGTSVVTLTQLHELQQQSLIYEHLAAGLPVPLRSVSPIWKSLPSTFGSNSTVIGFSSQGLTYKNVMDPEPRRCRRTDGKKWRCSKNIVLDQKYCERHMHRGRKRSRKPVEEASEVKSPSNLIQPNNSSKDIETSHSEWKNCVSSQSYDTRTIISTTIISGERSKNDANCHTPVVEASIPTNAVCEAPIVIQSANISTTITVASPSGANSAVTPKITTNYDRSCRADVKDFSGNDFGQSSSKSRDGYARNFINVQNTLSLGKDFSPNSVLQVLPCSNSSFDGKSGIELESARCRRTDGKKWRCSRDAVPNQKYCGLHMHRGSKNKFLASEEISASVAAIRSAHPPSATAMPTKTNSAILSTRGGNPQGKQTEEKGTASSSSETTITDTTIAGHANSNVSF